MRSSGNDIIELKHSSSQPWVALCALVVLAVYALYCAVSAVDGLRAVFAWLCAIILGVCAAVLGYRMPNIDLSKPVLVILPDGIIYRPGQNGLIPWQWITAVKIERTGNYNLLTQVAVYLRADAGSHLDGVLKDRSGLIGNRNFSEFRIPLNGFAGWQAQDIATIIKQRYSTFRAQNPNEQDALPGFESSAWTGLE